MASDFTVKGEWRTESYGHVYTAKAVATAGRILAIVNIEIPLDVATDLKSRFGPEWVNDVEKTAREDVDRVARGWEKPLMAVGE